MHHKNTSFLLQTHSHKSIDISGCECHSCFFFLGRTNRWISIYPAPFQIVKWSIRLHLPRAKGGKKACRVVERIKILLWLTDGVYCVYDLVLKCKRATPKTAAFQLHKMRTAFLLETECTSFYMYTQQVSQHIKCGDRSF